MSPTANQSLHNGEQSSQSGSRAITNSSHNEANSHHTKVSRSHNAVSRSHTEASSHKISRVVLLSGLFPSQTTHTRRTTRSTTPRIISLPRGHLTGRWPVSERPQEQPLAGAGVPLKLHRATASSIRTQPVTIHSSIRTTLATLVTIPATTTTILPHRQVSRVERFRGKMFHLPCCAKLIQDPESNQTVSLKCCFLTWQTTGPHKILTAARKSFFPLSK